MSGSVHGLMNNKSGTIRLWRRRRNGTERTVSIGKLLVYEKLLVNFLVFCNCEAQMAGNQSNSRFPIENQNLLYDTFLLKKNSFCLLTFDF